MAGLHTKLAFLLLLGVSGTATGQETAPPSTPAPLEEGEILDFLQDRAARMTVPVTIDGRGPYRFVVDTGAERTVIARELAKDLSLGRGPSARVHSMSEVSTIDTAIIGKLDVGGNSVRGIHAPTLARTYLGAEGMLGVDSLKAQRVSFDFAKQEMTVAPSRKREEKWDDGAIVVTGRSRFGHLVLVDASVEGQKVWVIVDTGSEVTIGNNALRRKLAAKNKLGLLSPIDIVSVTGGRLVADQGVMRKIRLGGMDITAMPIAFADVHPFKKLDLMDRPAILLGMDTLRLFDRVSVDFANRKVRMLAPPQSGLKGGIMLAAGERGRLGS
jgi:predicted aspartyl protease